MGKVKQSTKVARRLGGLYAAQFYPNFIAIHFRYAKDNFRVWAALFIAPFIAVKLSLIRVFEWLSTTGSGGSGGWQFDLLAIFCIALCFVMAERYRNFRKFYVYFAPAIMGLSLLYWAGGQPGMHLLTTGFAVKAALIGLLTYRVGRFTIDTGYQVLTDGADKNYRAGRDHYELGEYELAMPLLEKSAKKGHFKSQFLLGVAYENGHHYPVDKVLAAKQYLKATKKGHQKAKQRLQSIMDVMNEEQKAEIQGRLFTLLQDD